MEVSQPLLSRHSSSGHGTRNHLGTFNGVYIPCLMNILGIILFMRLSWSIGQSGVINVLIMFLIGETAALSTVMSMSAIISTGRMQGGGSYFLLSRSLGPEIGGAIGVFFYLAYAVGTSFYVVSFGTEIVDVFILSKDIQTEFSLEDEQMRKRYITIFSSIALWMVAIISYLGAESFAKINYLVFGAQFLCILAGIFSMYFFPMVNEVPYVFPQHNQTRYVGFSWQNLYGNLWEEYTVDSKCANKRCDFQTVFGIIFNAITGIMEGANLSGDLADPVESIPKGTIYAVLSAISLYIILIFSFSTIFERKTLQLNSNVLQDVTLPTHYVTVLGISIAAFAAALGSLFGGARVLQALARDNLPPDIGLKYFAKGSKRGDEPVRAVFFTFFIAQACTFIGDLDIISPIIASFFLITYASVNMTCLLLHLTGTPNFRPVFRYHSKQQAFVGMMLCIGIMIYLDVYYALYALLMIAFLIAYISWKVSTSQANAKDWGDVSQALMYHQVRKFLYRLDYENHPKHWRPSLVVIVPNIYSKAKSERLFRADLKDVRLTSGSPSTSSFGTFDFDEVKKSKDDNDPDKVLGLNLYLLHFCNRLKKGGLFILGQVVFPEGTEISKRNRIMENEDELFVYTKSLKRQIVKTLLDNKLKAIHETLLSDNFITGAFSLASLAGLGGMKPGTVVFDLESLISENSIELSNMLQDIIAMKKNILIMANMFSNELDEDETNSWSGNLKFLSPADGQEFEYVNVVLIVGAVFELELSGPLSLELQLGFGLVEKDNRKKIRIVCFVTRKRTDVDHRVVETEILARLKTICKEARIPDKKREFEVLLPFMYSTGSSSPNPKETSSLPLTSVLREKEEMKIAREQARETDFVFSAAIGNSLLAALLDRDHARNRTSMCFFLPLPKDFAHSNWRLEAQQWSNGLTNVILVMLGEDTDIISQQL